MSHVVHMKPKWQCWHMGFLCPI